MTFGTWSFYLTRSMPPGPAIHFELNTTRALLRLTLLSASALSPRPPYRLPPSRHQGASEPHGCSETAPYAHRHSVDGLPQWSPLNGPGARRSASGRRRPDGGGATPVYSIECLLHSA